MIVESLGTFFIKNLIWEYFSVFKVIIYLYRYVKVEGHIFNSQIIYFVMEYMYMILTFFCTC